MPRPHRRLLLVTAAGVGLLVAGGVVAGLGYADTSGPDGAVRQYYSALADADARAALAWGPVPDGSTQLLTSAVLREQQRIAPMRDIEVGQVRRTGDTARVRVRYRLEFPGTPVPVTETVTVHRRGGDWRLAAAAVSTQIIVDSAGDRARLLGHAVPSQTVALFPGAVPVRFDSPYLQLEPDSGRVGFDTDGPVDVAPRVSESARVGVVAAVTAALASCAGATAAPTCPLPSERYVPGSLRGTLGHGTLQVDVATGDAGLLRVTGTVPFTGRFERLDFTNRTHPGSGRLQLDVHAELAPVAPLRVHWTQS